MLYALCSMLYALCSLLYALCPLLHALCPLPSAGKLGGLHAAKLSPHRLAQLSQTQIFFVDQYHRARRWQKRSKWCFPKFIGESMLLTFVSALLALLLVQLLLPLFSKLVERELAFALLLQGKTFLGLLLAIPVVGLLAESYPAVFLTAFQPAQVLKSEIRDREARKKFDLIKRGLLENHDFIKVSASAHLPLNVGSQTGLGWTEREGQPALQSYQTTVDYDFLPVFEIELVEGRNFSREFSTDSAEAFIINEKLRDMLGWETAVGKPFRRDDEPEGNEIGIRKVLGASVGQLLLLLSQDFVKLVIVANVLAWPLVWFAMNQSYSTSQKTTILITASFTPRK